MSLIISTFRITFVLWVLLSLTSCSSTSKSPEDLKYEQFVDTLILAQDHKAPDVLEALQWMKETGRQVGAAYLFTKGANSDIIMEVVKITGADRQRVGHYTHTSPIGEYYGIVVTPFFAGNAFQMAIAEARPKLAERIAIYHAQQAGDYVS